MVSSSGEAKRREKPLPPTPSPTKLIAERIGETRNFKNIQNGKEANTHGAAQDIVKPVVQTMTEIKRICLSDEQFSFGMSVTNSSAWKRIETMDDQGLVETFYYNRLQQRRLRGCCSDSRNIVACCALCEHQDWIFQGSEYNPSISMLYAQNDGCIPFDVKLIKPKFIIPWRYKNRRTGKISWKIIHMCGDQVEDAECETIVVNCLRDRKLAKLIETVKAEAPRYKGAERVEYLLRIVRLALGDYGLPGGASSYQADTSLYAQMQQQGHNFMFLCSVKIGLCRHKALLFKILCDYCSIECALVTGYSTGGRHQWNVINLLDPKEGKEFSYIIDPTSPHFTWTKQGSVRMKAYKINIDSSFGHGGMTLLKNMSQKVK